MQSVERSTTLHLYFLCIFSLALVDRHQPPPRTPPSLPLLLTSKVDKCGMPVREVKQLFAFDACSLKHRPTFKSHPFVLLPSSSSYLRG